MSIGSEVLQPGQLVYLNGEFVPAGEACVPVDDAGFERGDGVFETVRSEAGAARHLADHLERLRDGLRRVEIEIPESNAQLAAAVDVIARAGPRPVARLRITVSRGATPEQATRAVAAAPYRDLDPDLLDKGVAVAIVHRVRVDSASPLARVKSTSYQPHVLAARMARQAGAWEGLLLNEHGRVAEGTRTNIVVQVDGLSVTPSLEEGCLPGTVRRRLVQACDVREAPITLDDVARASAVMLTNSLVGVVPVASLDGSPLPVPDVARRLRVQLETIRQRGGASVGWQ